MDFLITNHGWKRLTIRSLDAGCKTAVCARNTELNTLPTPDSSLIVYLSAIHRKITPNNVNAFGATYDDAVNVYDVETDYGIITFDGNMTAIGE